MSTFLDAYKAQLDQIVASKLAGTQASGNSSLANAYALLSYHQSQADQPTASEDQGHSGFLHGVKSVAGKALSPAQRILDIMSRPVSAVQGFEQSITADAATNPEKDPVTGVGKSNIGDALHAAKEGFLGHKYTGGSDVLKAAGWGKGDNGNFGRAAAGFGLDVINDPLSYIGVGAISKVGKVLLDATDASKVGRSAAEEALQKPAERAMADVAESGAAQTDPKTATSLLNAIAPDVQAQGIPLPFTRRFIAGEDGVAVAPAPKAIGMREALPAAKATPTSVPSVLDKASEAALIGARQSVESATSALRDIPRARYTAGTKIAPLYKTVEKEVATEAPTPAPVVKPATKAPAAVKTAVQKASQIPAAKARAVAIYQAVLNDPKHSLTITRGGRPMRTTVGELRALGGKSAESAKMVKTLLQNEARRIASLSPEQMAEQYDKPLRVNLTGKEGKGRVSIGVDEFSRLLETGEVPKPKAAYFKQGGEQVEQYTPETAVTGMEAVSRTDELNQFPIHTAEDLKDLHLTNDAGELESLGNYLKRAGVKVQNIDPQSVEKAVAEVAAKSEDDIFANAPDFSKPISGGVAAAKKMVTEFARLSPTERKGWIEAHKDILDPEDIDALMKVKISKTNTKAWDEAVHSVLNKRSAGGYTELTHMMDDLANGTVNKDDLKTLMTLTGAKTPAGIKRGLERILRNAEKLELEAGKAKGAQVDVSQWETPLTPNVEVKPAKAIIDEVVKDGNKTDLISQTQQLDTAQLQDLKAGIGHLVQKEIIDPQIAEKYPFTSLSGTLRTAKQINKGAGRNFDEWGKYPQLSVVNGIIRFRSKQIASELKKAGLKGDAYTAARSQAMYDHVMPVMRTIDKLLKENGIAPKLADHSNYTASLTDVLDVMPEEFVKKHFFDLNQYKNPKTGKVTIKNEHIPPTFWNDAGEIMLDYANGKIDVDAAREGIHNLLSATQKSRNGKYITPNTKLAAEKLGDAGPAYLDNLADTFLGATRDLAQQVERNTAEAIVHNVDGAGKVSQEAYDGFVQLVSSPEFASHDLLKVAANRDAIVESVAKSAGVVSPMAQRLALSDFLVKTSPTIPPEVAADARKAERLANGAKNPTKVLSDNLDDTESMVNQVFQDEGISLRDLGRKYESTMMYRIMRNLAPHLGNNDVRHFFLDRNSFGQTASRQYSAKFNEIAKMHPKENVTAAFKEMQRGQKSAVPEIAAAQDDLAKVIGSMFNGDDKYNIFKANNITPEQINAHFDKYHIPGKFRFTESGDGNFMDDWQKWDTEEPLDLMSKMEAAIQASVTERMIGADLGRNFGSKTKQAGYVKVKATKDSRLSQMLDPEMYFPKDIAVQMRVLDRAMQEFAKATTSGQLLKLYDPVLHSLKSGLTIYRVGHHVRNMVGDVWLSWMDGVNSPTVYKKALRVMADNRGRYADFDTLRALQTMNATADPAQRAQNILGATRQTKAGGHILTANIGGKATPLTSGQVYELAFKRGILPDYRTLEDIQFGEASSFKMPQLFKGKIHNAAATTSEARDHYARIAHFIDILEKGKFKSVEDAATQAADRVRKWHPDGSDLTHFESKVARRTFMFYSWIRKAIPLVAEAAVMKPGKVLAYPKAMYALAEAQGIDPQSLSDPFPVDQLFPSWIADSISGPEFGNREGGYWGINPGIPSQDVANQYVNNPVGAVAGSLVPFAKIPLEMYTANRSSNPNDIAVDAGTGVPYSDISDYVDRQIPGVNSIANMFNRSVTGLGQPQGVGLGDTEAEKQKAMQKNNPGLDATALFNWITGGGLQDMSKPSYIKQAQIEQGRGR